MKYFKISKCISNWIKGFECRSKDNADNQMGFGFTETPDPLICWWLCISNLYDFVALTRVRVKSNIDSDH